jgi:serine protease Do
MKLFLAIISLVIAFFVLRPHQTKHKLDPQLSKQLMESVASGFRDRVVKIKASGTVMTGVGTGFYINTSGDILTAYHVINDAGYLEVFDERQTRVLADVIGVNAKYDLAVLRARTSNPTPSATLGYDTTLEVGEPLVAIGNSKNEFLASKYGQFLSFERGDIKLAPPELIVSDVPVDHGDSGGPVLNSKGVVIGVTDAISRNGYGDFQSYFVPMSVLQTIIADMQMGKMDGVPGLGFQVLDSSAFDEAESTDSAGQVVVIYVYPNSAVDRAGIEAPSLSFSKRKPRVSVLKSVDGTAIDSVRQLYWLLADKNAGDTINAEFEDAGNGTQTVAIRLEARK